MVWKDTSKFITKTTVESIVSILKLSQISDRILGFFVTSIHVLFGIWILKNVWKQPVKTQYFMYVVIWLLVIASNYLFHGCILSRVEREFLGKDWCGPVSLLSIVGIPVQKDFANNVIKYAIAAPFTSKMILKLFDGGYSIIPWLFCGLCIPLLFLNPQNIFEGIFSLKKEIDFTESLDDKRVVISGGSSGIGKAFAIECLRKGATVILLNRPSKHADEFYREFAYTKRLHIYECDYSDLESVKDALSLLKDEFHDGIDILFNNAGISNTEPELTKDSYEKQIQVNFIAHAVVTNYLIPLLQKRKSKIINHSSIAYRIPSIPFEPRYFTKTNSLDSWKRPWLPQILYQQSKLAMILFTHALQAKLKNTSIEVIAFQPGICKTNILESSTLPKFLQRSLMMIASTPQTVAENLLSLLSKTNETSELQGPSIFTLQPKLLESLTSAVHVVRLLEKLEDIEHNHK